MRREENINQVKLMVKEYKLKIKNQRTENEEGF